MGLVTEILGGQRSWTPGPLTIASPSGGAGGVQAKGVQGEGLAALTAWGPPQRVQLERRDQQGTG